MLSEIKKELIKQPKRIQEILEYFDFCNVEIHDSYMNFGRNQEGSKKSIVIKLNNNDNVMVKDYPKNIYQDIFKYIIQSKKVTFNDVLNVIKSKLGISDYYDFFNNNTVFGGFYDNIKKRSSNYIKTYNNSILDNYKQCGNTRFLKDNISLLSQRQFKIGYDVESQSITIPIYNQLGDLMGVKARVNHEVEEGEQKYYYLVPCLMSQTLYGYSQNYERLSNSDIFLFEAEKSLLQCHSYDFYNAVALGSSSLSVAQIKMILELQPKRVIFMHDKGLEFETIQRNALLLYQYSKMFEIEIGYWNNDSEDIPEKASLSDLGRDRFEYGIKNEIIIITEEMVNEWIKNLK